MTLPSWSTRIRSERLSCENARPNGFTQKVCGSTGSRSVMCPATPSSKPYLPKMRNASARRPLRYSRSSYLSVKRGGEGNFCICASAPRCDNLGSLGAASSSGNRTLLSVSVYVAVGGAMVDGRCQRIEATVEVGSRFGLVVVQVKVTEGVRWILDRRSVRTVFGGCAPYIWITCEA